MTPSLPGMPSGLLILPRYHLTPPLPMVMDTQHGEQDVREGVVYVTEPLHFSAEAMQSSAEATEMDWYGENSIEEDALTPSSVEMDIALELEASESQEDDPVYVRVLHIDDDLLCPQVVPTTPPHAPMGGGVWGLCMVLCSGRRHRI